MPSIKERSGTFHARQTHRGELRPGHALVIGIGQSARSDDGAGIAVAEALRRHGPPEVDVVQASGDGAELINLWRDARHVFVINASRSGSEPGTVFRIDATEQHAPSRFFRHASHAFGVAEAVETARATNALPRRLVLYAIEGETFEHGTALTPRVRAAVDRAAAEIMRELGDIR